MTTTWDVFHNWAHQTGRKRRGGPPVTHHHATHKPGAIPAVRLRAIRRDAWRGYRIRRGVEMVLGAAIMALGAFICGAILATVTAATGA